jgi:hypothetical protein
MEDKSEAAVNALQLMLTCQKLFAAITKSIPYMPIQMKYLYSEIRRVIEQKVSSQAAIKAVAGFFFTRFVCPSLLAPHIFGLLDGNQTND